MNNKTTWLLAVCVVIILGVIGVGFLSSTQQATPVRQTTKKEPTLPNSTELAAKLITEQPAIIAAIQKTFPSLAGLYSVERGKLYHTGEWYGAVLQYKGIDSANRDTLRIVLRKQNSEWSVVTKPPQLLVSKKTIPDAPLSMLNDINKPAVLPGTENSPTITPNE